MIRMRILQRRQPSSQLQSGTEAAAARGYVDSVIEPASARKQLLYAFEMLYNKCEYPIGKKHGTI